MLKHPTKIVVLVITTVTLLTGCMNFQTTTTIKENGSGTFSLTIELEDLTASTLETAKEFVPLKGQGTIQERIQTTATQTFNEENGWKNVSITTPQNKTGIQIEAEFDNYKTLETTLAQPNDEGLFTSLSIEQIGTKWELVGTLNSLFSTPNTINELLTIFPSTTPVMTITFTLPGIVETSNSTTATESTATWDIIGDRTSSIRANWTSEPESGLPWINIAITALIAVIAITIFTATRKQQPTKMQTPKEASYTFTNPPENNNPKPAD